MADHIPFNRAFATGRELEYIAEAVRSGRLSGDGPFTARCSEWLETTLLCPRALLTHSCTAALEMAALLLEIRPEDEVILPSFTFVSTANAFLLRGATPIFVDIRPDTLNLDESLIEAAITPRTRAIVPVHYAGVGCEMEEILRIAEKHSLAVVEDAAQGLLSTYKGRALGTFGDFGTFSFHETKNVVAGEGGALILNRDRFVARAEVLREKGTNRKQFNQGLVDKYTWVDLGSSFLPGEIIAAFLWGQMEQAKQITARRLEVWERYHQAFARLEAQGQVRRPTIPEHCEHNAHMYYLMFADKHERDAALVHLRERGVGAVFHYIPLHSSPAGRRYGRVSGDGLPLTDHTSETLLRLPLWLEMGTEQDRVISEVEAFFRRG